MRWIRRVFYWSRFRAQQDDLGEQPRAKHNDGEDDSEKDGQCAGRGAVCSRGDIDLNVQRPVSVRVKRECLAGADKRSIQTSGDYRT